MRRAPKTDLTGRQFGRLTVVTWVPTHNRIPEWICDCSCGERTIVPADRLTRVRGNTKSCGCLRKEPWARKHGDKGSRLYSVWSAMKKRCYQVGSINYHNYGGRGIVLCDDWRDDYRAFKVWAMANGYEEGLSIDRIDNDKGYSPENCRWTTRTENNRNRRNTRTISVHGETLYWSEAAKRYGISYDTLKMRIYAGYSPENAVRPGEDPLNRRLLGAAHLKNVDKSVAERAEPKV